MTLLDQMEDRIVNILKFNAERNDSPGAAIKSNLLKDILSSADLTVQDKLNVLFKTNKVGGVNLGLTIARYNRGSLTHQYISLLRHLLNHGVAASSILQLLSYQGHYYYTGLYYYYVNFIQLLGMYGTSDEIHDVLQLLKECSQLINLVTPQLSPSVPYQESDPLGKIISILNNDSETSDATHQCYTFFTSITENKNLADKNIDMSFLTAQIKQYILSIFSLQQFRQDRESCLALFKNHPNKAYVNHILKMPKEYDDALLRELRHFVLAVEKYDVMSSNLTKLFNYANSLSASTNKEELIKYWTDLLEMYPLGLDLKQQGNPTPEVAAKLCEGITVCIGHFLAAAGSDVVDASSKDDLPIQLNNDNSVRYTKSVNRSLMTRLFRFNGRNAHNHKNIPLYDYAVDQLIFGLRSDVEKLIFYVNLSLFCYRTLDNKKLQSDSSYQLTMTFIDKLLVLLHERLPVEETKAFMLLNDKHLELLRDRILNLLTSKGIVKDDVFFKKIEKSQEIYQLLKHIDKYLEESTSSVVSLIKKAFGNFLRDDLIRIRDDMRHMISVHLETVKKIASIPSVDFEKLHTPSYAPYILNLNSSPTPAQHSSESSTQVQLATGHMNASSATPLVPPVPLASPIISERPSGPESALVPLSQSFYVQPPSCSFTSYNTPAHFNVFSDISNKASLIPNTSEVVKHKEETLVNVRSSSTTTSPIGTPAKDLSEIRAAMENLMNEIPPVIRPFQSFNSSEMIALEENTPLADAQSRMYVPAQIAAQPLTAKTSEKLSATSAAFDPRLSFTFFGGHLSSTSTTIAQTSATSIVPDFDLNEPVELESDREKDLESQMEALPVVKDEPDSSFSTVVNTGNTVLGRRMANA